MSFCVDNSELDKDWKEYIKRTCIIYEKPTIYNRFPTDIVIFKEYYGDTVLPLALWNKVYNEFPNKTMYEPSPINFIGEPQENEAKDQQTVLKEALEKLYKDHYLFLALRTGFGKTFCALYLICNIGVKTVVISHSDTIKKQWVDEAKQWCPDLVIRIVKSEKDLKKYANVYIIGLIMCTHLDDEAFADIDMVIVDEAHLIYTSTFSNALLKFRPQYLIGLSATPDRKDGKDRMLYPFFGEKETFIVRHQVKDFTVIKYNTPFQPNIVYNRQGNLDWSEVISSIAFNKDRQRFIANLCKDYPNDKILILDGRVDSCISIYDILKTCNENVDYLTGTKKTYDKDCRILVSTIHKLGVGFNSDRTLLILCTDNKDVRQYEGRIRCDNNIIIDIVDGFGAFEKHWRLREKWYLERGATIVKKLLK